MKPEPRPLSAEERRMLDLGILPDREFVWPEAEEERPPRTPLERLVRQMERLRRFRPGAR